MVMKILLFGKNGQVGWELQRSLAVLGEVTAVDWDGTEHCGDFANTEGVLATVRALQPDVIVNAAAHTAVDKAESEPERARVLNATTPGQIALEAARLGVHVIQEKPLAAHLDDAQRLVDADLPAIFLATAKMTAIVILMLAASSIMSWVMAFTKIPALIASGLLSFTDSFLLILLIMNLVLLLVGTFMDPTPAVLIFTPIFLPICTQFGMDPVQFGIMMIFNLSLGTITPPVGPILFTGCKIGEIKIEGVIKPLLPFFAVIVLVLMLVTYVPQISLALPSLMGYVK